jgi:hypothetical protein
MSHKIINPTITGLSFYAFAIANAWADCYNGSAPATGPNTIPDGIGLIPPGDNGAIGYLSGITFDHAYIARVFLDFDVSGVSSFLTPKIVITRIDAGDGVWPNPGNDKSALFSSTGNNWNGVGSVLLSDELIPPNHPFGPTPQTYNLNSDFNAYLTASLPSGHLLVSMRVAFDYDHPAIPQVNLWDLLFTDIYLDLLIPDIPSVNTNAATNVGFYSAQLNGTLVNPGAGFDPCGFEWGTTIAYGNTTPTTSQGGIDLDFDQVISGLAAGTTYHFRAFANIGEAGNVYGADMTFTTKIPIAVRMTYPVKRRLI